MRYTRFPNLSEEKKKPKTTKVFRRRTNVLVRGERSMVFPSLWSEYVHTEATAAAISDAAKRITSIGELFWFLR